MLDGLRRLSQLCAWISGGALILASLAIAVEVVLRKAFSVSLGGVDEVASYVFAIGVAFSLSFTLLARAHIRIDVVYARLPRRWRTGLDLLAMTCLLGVAGLLLQQAFATTSTSFELGARSNTPLGVRLWIPQFLWTAGLLFFVVTILALLVASVRALLLRRDDEVRALMGVRTIDEEIRDDS